MLNINQTGLAGIFMLCLLSALAACGGGGKGGAGAAGGGTPAALATGTFTRSVGASPTSDNIMPFGTVDFADVKHQALYTAADVGATGWITAVRFKYFSTLATDVTCPNTTVRLGHSSLAALTTSFTGNIDRSSLQTVFDDATLTIPAGSAGAWFTITLATPFQYNGLDNLVVEVERTTTCSGNVRIATINGAGNRRAASQAIDTQAGTAQHNTTTAGTIDVTQPSQQFVFSGGDNHVSYSGSASSNGIPFAQSNLPEFRHAQILYHADEINGSGPITGIAFVQNQPSTMAANYFVTIKFGHTTLSTLTDTFAGNFNSGAPATVASNLAINVPGGIPAGRPIWVPLTGAFSYNGSDNLVVDIEVTGPLAASTFMRAVTLTGRRLYAAVGATTGTVDNQGYDILFRFHGGSMDVMPIRSSYSTQAFGRPAGGQIQNLYRSTYLGTGGTIDSVAVRLNDTPGAATIPNYKIYLGHTAKTTLSTSDSYASNMDGGVLVYSGALTVASGLSAGDWITIPLQTTFAYDPTKNLVLLISGDNPLVTNTAVTHADATEFPSHAVGRDDNAVGTSGLPTWNYDGAVSVRFGLQ